MQRGRSMGMVVLSVVAVIALIGAVYIFIKSEDVSNEALLSRIADLESAVARVDRQMVKQQDMAEIEDSVFKLEAELDKAKSAHEVLYKQWAANKVEIDQKKPFYVHLIPPKVPAAKPAKQVKKK